MNTDRTMEAAAARAQFIEACSGRLAASMNAAEYLDAFRSGSFVMEADEGIVVLRSGWREIVPIEKEMAIDDLSHEIKRAVRRRSFSVSTNQNFEDLLARCAQPRRNASHGKNWLHDNTKSWLRALHQDGHAHSIEIWQGEDLAAGLIGLQTGSVYIGLSAHHAEGTRGAGNMAFLEMQARLARAGFKIFDVVNPSSSSRLLRGQMLPSHRVDALRRSAVRERVEFPTAPVLMPAKECARHPAPPRPGVPNPSRDVA